MTTSTAEAQSTTHKRQRGKSSLFSYGEPMVWIAGGFLALALAMIILLLGTVLYRGLGTFWPGTLVEVTITNENGDEQDLLGYWTRNESGIDRDGKPFDRDLLRVANAEITHAPFVWIAKSQIQRQSQPTWALTVERYADDVMHGPFYGFLQSFRIDEKTTARDPASAWAAINEHHDAVMKLRSEAESIKTHEVTAIEDDVNAARIAIASARINYGADSAAVQEAEAAYERIQQAAIEKRQTHQQRIAELEQEAARYDIQMTTIDGQAVTLPLAMVVRAFPANQLGFFGKLEVYISRWGEFLWENPRESNMYGGVFPMIVGTVAMTLLMTVLVVPFGVIAALYMREYAKQGYVLSMVRIAINNLAGVPSIVFGVFGAGFFCYWVGGGIDWLFFPAYVEESQPVFGKTGMVWAALTMALLTLPVVIVATEEALAAVPGSIREASYGCGASKWQTIQRIVLPHAAPGILTGTILAMARGAGEVAPLMLVGAVHLAPELPINGDFPFLTNNSFMHLGLSIFTIGFNSPDSEAARPMVYTITLLLIVIVALLNITAIWLRGRLNAKYAGAKL